MTRIINLDSKCVSHVSASVAITIPLKSRHSTAIHATRTQPRRHPSRPLTRFISFFWPSTTTLSAQEKLGQYWDVSGLDGGLGSSMNELEVLLAILGEIPVTVLLGFEQRKCTVFHISPRVQASTSLRIDTLTTTILSLGLFDFDNISAPPAELALCFPWT